MDSPGRLMASRAILFALAVLAVGLGVATWVGQSGRSSTSDTTVSTMPVAASTAVPSIPSPGTSTGAPVGTVITTTHATAAPSGSRSETLTVALLTFGVALLVSAILIDRISEIVIAGATIKLKDLASKTQDVTERTTARAGDPQAAVADFLAQLVELSRTQRTVSQRDLDQAADGAVAQNAPTAEPQIEFRLVEDRPTLTVGPSGDPESTVEVTDEPELLFAPAFAPEAAASIAAAASANDLALFASDGSLLGEALAAVRFASPDRAGRAVELVTIALRTDEWAQASETAAGLLLRYLSALGRRLNLPAGVAIDAADLTIAQQQSLAGLGFRATTDAEADAAGVGDLRLPWLYAVG
jgi:hypothetical protein